jgi:uncharacterized phage-associated protein
MAEKIVGAQQVADYFLWKARTDHRPMTNKKLQKMLYYAQAWSLVLQGGILFGDRIEAWVHGPAIRKVYLEYKKYGFSPIRKVIAKSDRESFSKGREQLLEQVWSVYGKHDSAYLEHLTHSEMPWQKAREGLEISVGSNIEITPASMKEYYTGKLEDFKTGNI